MSIVVDMFQYVNYDGHIVGVADATDFLWGQIMQQNILVLCTGNSCRSQMAEGYLRHFAGHAFKIHGAMGQTRKRKYTRSPSK